MQNLKTLIAQLEKGRNLHISILDLGGLLNTPATEIDFQNVIHSKKFCDIAKSTERGYRVCMRCKMLANTKATTCKSPFLGQCSYGLYEAAVPVVTEKNAMAIVYVGNAILDKEQAAARIERICQYTGASYDALCRELDRCEFLADPAELLQIAEIVSDYLKLLYESAPRTKTELHWLVSLMKQHAHKQFCANISLKELAVTYQKNEKYMGRLFKKEMGVSFHEYCMELRLDKARKMLLQSNEKIINIALDCGFNNISYFNRAFFRKYGASPTAYRINI